MPLMLLPILGISFSQFLISNHEQVLCIILLGSLGEIERSSNHGFPIYNHYLIVSYGVLSIYLHRNSLVIEEGG